MMNITGSQAELPDDRELTREMLGANLRELTSNLMRVVRGAGRPGDVTSQMASVVDWFERYEEAGDGPVRVGDLPSLFRLPLECDADDLRGIAINDIVNGALQVAASRLVGQAAFERQGEQEILRGIAAYQEAIESRS